MKDIMSGKLYIYIDMVQDTEKMTEIMLDYFEFDKFKCSGKFDDGTTCECGSVMNEYGSVLHAAMIS